MPLVDRDGSVNGIVGISRDITQRELAERALADERKLLRAVIDNVPDSLCVKDPEGRYDAVSRSWPLVVMNVQRLPRTRTL